MPQKLALLQIADNNVVEYLQNLEICSLSDKENVSIEIKPAKNFNLLVSFSNSKKILVKQERQIEKGKTFDELINEWKVRCFLQENPEISFLTQQMSKVFYFDRDNSILVLEYVDNYEELFNWYIKEKTFPINFAQRLGQVLATLHKFSSHREDCKNSFQPKFNYPDVINELDRVGPEIFGVFSPDGIKFVSLYQRYDSLRQAINELKANWMPTCLIHGDFKLNNILVLSELLSKQKTDGENQFPEQGIRVIDWERCCWGDPVCDFGTMISSYLLIWFNSLIIDNSISINESLKMAGVPLDLLQPSIKAFYESYLEVFPEIMSERPNLQIQVVQHTGFAIIRQIQAALQYEHRLGNLSICMLQVAKSLLCRPEQFISTLFGK